jgi:uncharacterized membrane protein YphA (DoxX/SURF4 family)|tara:strand:- start:394 stop:816 length:423 start_codon:yes stop_codon:yes gene_type:complete
MNNTKYLNKLANEHTYYSLNIIRVGLGVFIFYKGLYFMNHMLLLSNLIEPLKNYVGEIILLHYIVPAHLIGGVLIIIGLLTRWAISAQIPILIGALFVNILGDMSILNLVIIMSIIFVSLFFLIYGSGKNSVDYYLKMEQ